jgi:hypothetical protein
MRVYTTIILLIFLGVRASAQNDTLVMKNGDEMVGEIKELSTGVLTVKTDYSDKDFRVEWEKVGEIHTKNTFVISHTDGRRINGTIATDPEDSSMVMIFEPGGIISVRRMDIVALKQLENTFLGRLDASIDIGFNITKANNLRQFTSRSYLGYTGRFWGSDASMDVVRSLQDSIRTDRLDASLSGRWLFQKSWFLYLSAKFLQNNEQKLKLRTNTNGGIGKLFVNTNKIYFGTQVGMAWNNEQFTDDTPTRNSLEAAIGLQLNLFNIEDLSLLTTGILYPSITERGRVRLDFKIDLKYDLPLDFYIKFGYTHNFDNQPIEGASVRDYVLNATFGWEL